MQVDFWISTQKVWVPTHGFALKTHQKIKNAHLTTRSHATKTSLARAFLKLYIWPGILLN